MSENRIQDKPFTGFPYAAAKDGAPEHWQKPARCAGFCDGSRAMTRIASHWPSAEPQAADTADQAFWADWAFFSQIIKTATSLGFTPGMRPAWPKVRGMRQASFWRASMRMPVIAA